MTSSSDSERIFPIPGDEFGAWIGQARALPIFECEAIFGIQDSLYIGPQNNIAPGQWERERVKLIPPEIPRRLAGSVTTAEVVGREEVLADYYRRLVALMRKHERLDDGQPFPYFRTQPAILSGEDVLTAFSWSDDVLETKAILEILAQSDKAPPSLLHQDCEQGWEIMIVADGPSVFLIEWDGEGPPPVDKGFRFDAKAVSEAAAGALERFLCIHAYLVSALGHDYWTYKYKPSPAPPVAERKTWQSAVRRFLGMGS